jgi:hypothetical protein
MSRADYERPAFNQISRHYKCRKCGQEQEVPNGFSAAMPCPSCRGYVEFVGESYPASADDWDEVRDGVNEPWRQKR